MVELGDHGAAALRVDANAADIVNGTVTNHVGILGCLVKLIGSTPHAYRRPWVTAMQIRIVHDTVFNDVTGAFNL